MALQTDTLSMLARGKEFMLFSSYLPSIFAASLQEYIRLETSYYT